MNASHKLFSRFEKAGPSWLPIILLSLIGLVATILSVRIVAEIASGELPDRIRRLYLVTRDYGSRETILFDVAAVDQTSLSETEREPLQTAGAMFPNLTFLGVLAADPAFDVAMPSGSGPPNASEERADRLMYFWSDPSGTSVLLGQWKPFWDRPAGNPDLAGVILLSRPADLAAPFIATIAMSGEIALDPNELVVDVDGFDAAAIEDLLNQHRRRLDGIELLSVESQGIDVLAQDFLNQRAFAFINRGGLTTEELMMPLQDSGDDVPEESKRLIANAFLLGWRNGISMQIDRHVLERLWRDGDFPADSAEERETAAANLLVIHPVSCPIRTREVLSGVDPTAVTPVGIAEIAPSVRTMDFPADIVDRIKAFAERPTAVGEIQEMLEAEIRKRDDCKEIFRIESPFPATVYEVERSS